MDESLKKYLDKAELIMATEKHSLYVDRNSNTVFVYNGKDIWEVSLDDLGKIGWE